MDEKLQAMEDAWAVKTEESRARAMKLAEEYVSAHPEEFSHLEKYVDGDEGIDKLVALTTSYRKAGMAEEVVKMEAFMRARPTQREVGGTAAVKVKPWKGA